MWLLRSEAFKQKNKLSLWEKLDEFVGKNFSRIFHVRLRLFDLRSQRWKEIAKWRVSVMKSIGLSILHKCAYISSLEFWIHFIYIYKFSRCSQCTESVWGLFSLPPFFSQIRSRLVSSYLFQFVVLLFISLYLPINVRLIRICEWKIITFCVQTRRYILHISISIWVLSVLPADYYFVFVIFFYYYYLPILFLYFFDTFFYI